MGVVKEVVPAYHPPMSGEERPPGAIVPDGIVCKEHRRHGGVILHRHLRWGLLRYRVDQFDHLMLQVGGGDPADRGGHQWEQRLPVDQPDRVALRAPGETERLWVGKGGKHPRRREELSIRR